VKSTNTLASQVVWCATILEHEHDSSEHFNELFSGLDAALDFVENLLGVRPTRDAQYEWEVYTAERPTLDYMTGEMRRHWFADVREKLIDPAGDENFEWRVRDFKEGIEHRDRYLAEERVKYQAEEARQIRVWGS
jgi:hypothetical protein